MLPLARLIVPFLENRALGNQVAVSMFAFVTRSFYQRQECENLGRRVVLTSTSWCFLDVLPIRSVSADTCTLCFSNLQTADRNNDGIYRHLEVNSRDREHVFRYIADITNADLVIGLSSGSKLVRWLGEN